MTVPAICTSIFKTVPAQVYQVFSRYSPEHPPGTYVLWLDRLNHGGSSLPVPAILDVPDRLWLDWYFFSRNFLNSFMSLFAYIIKIWYGRLHEGHTDDDNTRVHAEEAGTEDLSAAVSQTAATTGVHVEVLGEQGLLAYAA